MKKILLLICTVLFVAACFPKLPEIVTLPSTQLPVVTDKTILWQSEDYQG